MESLCSDLYPLGAKLHGQKAHTGVSCGGPAHCDHMAGCNYGVKN